MSAISKDGYEQIVVIKAALDSMYDKLSAENLGGVKDGGVFAQVKDEFEAIAGIVELAGSWTEV